MKKLETLSLSVMTEFNDLHSDALLSIQVWKRARKIGLHSFLVRDDIDKIVNESGAKLQEALNQSTPQLIMHGRNNELIDFSEFDFSSADQKAYAIEIIGCNNIVLRNIHLTKMRCNGIYIGNSKNIVIEKSSFTGLEGFGIVIGAESRHITLKQLHMTGLSGAGIFIGERSKALMIEDCIIEKGLGKSNWTAGIVLTDRCCTDLRSSPNTIFGPDGYWALQQPIFDRDYIVGQCVIRNNAIRDNLASGIYLDGTFDNVILENKLSRNSKEGVCFDYGATRNIFAFNLIEENGNRYGKTDDDLAKDFVLHHGRCEDGTAAAKVPGVSIDNSILNCIQYNTVVGNYGSGIKLVRTSFLNNIGFNSCIKNNAGENAVNHFFGIEVGAAVPDGDPPKNIPMELDFIPSGSNVVYRNLISSGHYAGIFLDKGTKSNHIFDNMIFDCKQWSMEAIDEKGFNSSLNNLSFQDSRNIALSRSLVGIIGMGSIRL